MEGQRPLLNWALAAWLFEQRDCPWRAMPLVQLELANWRQCCFRRLVHLAAWSLLATWSTWPLTSPKAKWPSGFGPVGRLGALGNVRLATWSNSMRPNAECTGSLWPLGPLGPLGHLVQWYIWPLGHLVKGTAKWLWRLWQLWTLDRLLDLVKNARGVVALATWSTGPSGRKWPSAIIDPRCASAR